MQSEIVERGRVYLSEFKNSPSVTSQKAANLSTVGADSEGIINYCICLRKAVSATKSFLKVSGGFFLGHCDMSILFRNVVSHYYNVIGETHNIFKGGCWIQKLCTQILFNGKILEA